jgi:hypothetical protein
MPKLQVQVGPPSASARITRSHTNMGVDYGSLRNWATKETGTWWPELRVLTPAILSSYADTVMDPIVGTGLGHPSIDAPYSGAWVFDPTKTHSRDTFDNAVIKYGGGLSVNALEVKPARDGSWVMACTQTPYSDTTPYMPGNFLFSCDIASWDAPSRRTLVSPAPCPDCARHGITTPQYEPHLLFSFETSDPASNSWYFVVSNLNEVGTGSLAGASYDDDDAGRSPGANLYVYYGYTDPTLGKQATLLATIPITAEAVKKHGDTTLLHLFFGHVAGQMVVGFSDNQAVAIIPAGQNARRVGTGDGGYYLAPLSATGAFNTGPTSLSLHGVNVGFLMTMGKMYWRNNAFADVDFSRGDAPYGTPPTGSYMLGFVPATWGAWFRSIWSNVYEPPTGEAFRLRMWPDVSPSQTIHSEITVYGPAPPTPLHYDMACPALGAVVFDWAGDYSLGGETLFDVSKAVLSCTVDQNEPEDINCIEATVVLDYDLLERFCPGWKSYLLHLCLIVIDGGWEGGDLYRLLEGYALDVKIAAPGYKQATVTVTARDFLARLQAPAGMISVDNSMALDLINPTGSSYGTLGYDAIAFMLSQVLGPDFANFLHTYISPTHWTLWSGYPWRKGAMNGTNGVLWAPPYGSDFWGWAKEVAQYDCAVMFMRRFVDEAGGQSMQPVYGGWYELASSMGAGLFAAHTVYGNPTVTDEDTHVMSLDHTKVPNALLGADLNYIQKVLYNQVEVQGTSGGTIIPSVVMRSRDIASLTDPASVNYCPWPQTFVLRGAIYAKPDFAAALSAAIMDRFIGRRPVRGPWRVQGQPDWQWGDTITLADDTPIGVKNVAMRITQINHSFVKKGAQFTTTVSVTPVSSYTL